MIKKISNWWTCHKKKTSKIVVVTPDDQLVKATNKDHTFSCKELNNPSSSQVLMEQSSLNES